MITASNENLNSMTLLWTWDRKIRLEEILLCWTDFSLFCYVSYNLQKTTHSYEFFLKFISSISNYYIVHSRRKLFKIENTTFQVLLKMLWKNSSKELAENGYILNCIIFSLLGSSFYCNLNFVNFLINVHA